ncbi:HMG domain-containing protein 4-like isoform X2 [Osmerus mordax]
MYETASPHFLTTYQTCDSPDEWREGEGSSEAREESIPMYWVYVDDKLGQSEASAVGHMTAEVSPSSKDPDLRPIEAAAHLQLLGESLSLIGHRLQGTMEMVTLSGSLSLLLDSLLCALAPLAGLTSQVPELNSCPSHTLADTLDNIAYVMPGL